jgi:hypothetical protein
MKALLALLLLGCSGMGDAIVDNATVAECKLASETDKQAVFDEFWEGPVSAKRKAQLKADVGSYTYRCAIREGVVLLRNSELSEHGMDALARFEEEL